MSLLIKPNDYITMLYEMQYEEERNTTMAVLEEMEYEAEYLMNCMCENRVLTEADSTVKTSATGIKEKGKGIFGTILAAIKNLMNAFSRKFKEISAKLGRFKDEYLDKITNMSFEGIKITMLPYHKTDDAASQQLLFAMKNMCLSMTESITKLNIANAMSKVSSNKTAAAEDLESEVAKLSKYADKSPEELFTSVPKVKIIFKDNMTVQEAARRYFITGTDFIVPTAQTLDKPDAVHNAIEVFAKYIREYEANHDNVSKMQKELDDSLEKLVAFENDLERHIQSLGTAPAKESFILGVGCLGTCSNYFSVFEAEEGESASPTAVKVENAEGGKIEKQPSVDPVKKQLNAIKKYLGLARTMFTTTINVMTVFMTYMEQKLSACQKAITYVVKMNGNVDKSEKEQKTEAKSDAAKEKAALQQKVK